MIEDANQTTGRELPICVISSHGHYDGWMALPQNVPAIRERTIRLHAGARKCWRHDPVTAWVSVEQAALAQFQQEGWSGDSGEGKIVLSLIKAASFTKLPTTAHSLFVEYLYSNKPAMIDVREFNIKLGLAPETPPCPSVNAFNQMRQAEILSPSDMIANILTATEQRISDNFSIMTAPGSHTLSFFPTLTLDNILGLYSALGNLRLSQIAAAFARAPYMLRGGWPDLTLWRGAEVVFKEIKAPGDRPRGNQIQPIEMVLLPLRFDVELVRVLPVSS